jgi:hypothetical protein
MKAQSTARPTSPMASPAMASSTPRTSAGVGYSENANSREAGLEAARAALAEAGAASCDLVLLFATDKHDPVVLRDAVRSVVGPTARIVGGSAMGVITRDRLGYEGQQVGVAVISSDAVQVDIFAAPGLADDEYAVGCALGAQLRSATFEGEPNLLLLYDIVKRQMSEGLSLNMATPLLAGLGDALGEWPRTAGVGMMGSLQWNPGFQWVDDRIEHHNALAVVFHGGVRMDTCIMHGCRPSSGYHTITKSDGNVVLELDGEPMRDVIARLTGGDESDWKDYPLFVTLGINNGDKFGEYREGDYAVRLCMDVDRERGGLVFFGDDLVTGTVVQLMRRSIDFDYIGKRAEELIARLGGRQPFLALYIDCAGRAAAVAGTEREEAEEVQRVIGARMPLLGWYGGCEIAKAGPVMQSHNWTGVLSILSV